MTAEQQRDEVLDQLVIDYLDAAESIEKHQRVKDELAAAIMKRLPVGETHKVGDGGVRVQAPPQRFDAKLAAELLDADQLAAISESKPSPRLAKEYLPGALVKRLSPPSGAPSLRRL